jgi:hydroxyethylthiazole kinase-like uncharacterized protein yjeF
MLIRRHPIDVIQLIPKRIKESHKGTYGRLLVIAGSSRYTGAVALMVEAALRSGVGIVYVIATHLAAQVIRQRTPEAVVIEAPEINGGFDRKAVDTIRQTLEEFNIDAIGVGPGIGRLKQSDDFYEGLLELIRMHKLNALIDADALAPIFQKIRHHAFNPNQLVFTPHPKEFLGMTMQESISDINKDVLSASKKVRQVIVYKTSTTIIANDEGIWRAGTGNESLATAGSGDVLSGMISSFLAQGVLPYDAAKLGVYMHGLIAEIATHDLGLRSLIASDLCNYIAKGFQELVHDNG